MTGIAVAPRYESLVGRRKIHSGSACSTIIEFTGRALRGLMRLQRNRVATTSHIGHSTGCYALVVSAVLMSGFGGRIGGYIAPGVQLPAVTPKQRAWNKGRIISQKRPLPPKQVWAIDRCRFSICPFLIVLTRSPKRSVNAQTERFGQSHRHWTTKTSRGPCCARMG